MFWGNTTPPGNLPARWFDRGQQATPQYFLPHTNFGVTCEGKSPGLEFLRQF